MFIILNSDCPIGRYGTVEPRYTLNSVHFSWRNAGFAVKPEEYICMCDPYVHCVQISVSCIAQKFVELANYQHCLSFYNIWSRLLIITGFPCQTAVFKNEMYLTVV